MEIVSLVELESRALDEGRLCAPSRSQDERVVIWTGLPPPAVADETGIARVVLQGESDGRRLYGETVPRGVRLSADDDLPEALRYYVVGRVMQAVAVLHRSQQVHGSVSDEQVWLGLDGEVRLTGRGRRGSVPLHDLLAAAGLLGTEHTLPGRDGDEAAHELMARAGLDPELRLGDWVRDRFDPDAGGEAWLMLEVSDNTIDGSVDEISPDLGPDDSERGIMDRWSVTGSLEAGGPELTAELTDGGRGSQLSLELWSRLAIPPTPPPAHRFEAVAGQSSRGIRGLLAEEVPDVLPAPIEARISSLIVGDPETSVTSTRTAQYSGHLAEPEYVRDTRTLQRQRPEPAGRSSVPLWQLAAAMVIGGLAVFSLMRLLG